MSGPANTPRRSEICFALRPLPGDTATHLLGSKGDGKWRTTLADRLWPKVAGPWCEGVAPTDCWLWLGAQGRNGNLKKRSWHYGRIRDEAGVMIGAHVGALLVTGHAKPDGDYVACHACNNHLCCNPGHLYWGTWADNMRDQVANGTRSFVPGSVYSRSVVADWMAAEQLDQALAE